MNRVRTAGAVTVSIVSHGHSALLTELLGDLARLAAPTRIVLTFNVPEKPPPVPDELIPRLTIVTNTQPLGFGANHNAAFRLCDTEFFCVMNPDIRMPTDPFPTLLASLSARNVAMAAPAVMSPDGAVQATGRIFPTLWNLARKAAGLTDGGVPLKPGGAVVRPDWIAGMFMLLRSDAFASVAGFDEKFHLYYEDVDLCVRLRNARYELLLCPGAAVVHDARRSSHTQPRFMIWHLQSMLRYFVRHSGRLPARHQTE